MTSFAGLTLYIDWIMATGLNQAINETMNSKSQGLTDSQIINSIILLNIAGGAVLMILNA